MKTNRSPFQATAMYSAVLAVFCGRASAQKTLADIDKEMRSIKVNTLGVSHSNMMPRQRQSERLIGLGYRLLAAHDAKGAEAAFRKSIPLAIVPVEALFGLAQAQTEEGKHLNALKTYRAMTDTHTRRDSSMKSEPRVLLYYALAAMQANQWNEAVTAYNDAIGDGSSNKSGGMVLQTPFGRLDPRKPEPALLKAMAHIGIGERALQTGPNEEAVKQFTLATQVAPSSARAVAYRYLGDALKQGGNKEQAQAAYRKADHLH